MFGSGISFGGLASGLDTGSIIEQLVALERIPIQQIEAQKAGEKTKFDLVGAFAGLVQTLQDKANALGSSDKFFSYMVGASLEGIASFSATGSAEAGSHTLEVIRTASIDRWAFDAVTDPTVDLATADGQAISFDVNGTSYSVDVLAADSNLHEIAAAINSEAGVDVTASVVNTGTAANPSYQLVVASKNSGTDFRVENLASTITGLTVDGTGPDGSGNAQSSNNITVGLNAQAVVDGLTIERTDNDFSDVLIGVSIDLLSANAGSPITFTVEPDREAIRGRIEEMVEAYNAVVDFINKQNSFAEESGAGGELFGDPILRRVRTELNSALFSVDISEVQADAEGYSTLSLIGISQDKDGRLSINDSTLDEKMSNNLALFADLFVDTDGFERVSDEPNTAGYFQDATEDKGLGDLLYRALDRLTSTQEGPVIDAGTGQRLVLDGLFDARKEVLQGNMKRYDNQIEAKERRLEVFEQNLIRRFAVLEELMGQLNAQSAALTS
jgi:flagellar hook-associated protein 2